nr:hypothetical protein [Tanacetum cinerariifolium]
MRLLIMLERKVLKFEERRMEFRIQQKKVIEIIKRRILEIKKRPLEKNLNKNLKDCLVKGRPLTPANTNSNNILNIVSSPVNVVSSSFTIVDPGRERAQRNEFESMFRQDKDANDNRMFTSVSATGSTYVNLDGLILVNTATLSNADLPTDPLMPGLEDTANLQDTGIFSGASDDEVEGAVADFNNLELTIVVSPIPTTRIHKDHPKEQII